MHLKRLMTAFIALPVLIWLIAKGSPFLFTLLVSAIALLALYEYYQITGRPFGTSALGWIPAVGYASGLAVIWAAFFDSPEMMIRLIVINLLVTCLISIVRIRFEPKIIESVFRQTLAVLYIPVLISSLVFIRNGSNGTDWIFYLFSVVFVGDAAAFYAGTFFGRHKLIPLVSPGKTVEGSIAGIAGNMGAGLLCKTLLALPISWMGCLLFSLLMGIAAQVGDLFESQMKRAADIKDSGSILPGHGGILDRFDATLFAAPVLYLLMGWII
jgi:phosphatidate cytidylyltransferase